MSEGVIAKIMRAFKQNRGGSLLLTLLIVLPLLWFLCSFTMDSANALYGGIKTKMALNRAVKSAVLAIDESLLAEGEIAINTIRARENFDSILKSNLGLNSDFTPTNRSPLMDKPEIIDYYVYQGPVFPFTYYSVMDIRHEFNNPGIIVVMRVTHKYVCTGREQIIFAYAVAEVKRNGGV